MHRYISSVGILLIVKVWKQMKQAFIYYLWLVHIEHGFTFINIMCFHTHAQNHFGVTAQEKQDILIYFSEDSTEIFKKEKLGI